MVIFINYNKSPGEFNSEIIACLECVLNPTDWYRSPFCNTYLHLNQDGSTSELNRISETFRP